MLCPVFSSVGLWPRGSSYFFLGTHACPASLVPLREFRFSSAGWCGSGVRIAPLRGCYPVAYYEACIGLLLCALYVYRVYLQIRWRYGKLDVAALRLIFLVLPQAMAISTSFFAIPVYNNYLTSLMLMARYTLLDQV